ncbi:MAG: hypothetical protein Unbinned4512contig1001_29 [Prokaryotic dsDNA virus sp.]|mgnify:CR=1 FL=1|nr:MAG: hypothetical protein Unbinned4512contig1001_29 [Prokaryotic dsDNA virus sp.]|tara:strand:- start:883 stop:1335 length:453 start_codon:yes stop_codon:yes gene_type:complete
MYTVSKIVNIDGTTFDSIYESNKTQLVQNIGYDDIDNLRRTFEDTVGVEKIFFQAVDDNDNVVAYFAGLPEGNTAFMYNMVTKTTDTLAQTVESSASILKSLGYTHVDFCVKDGTATQTYCKNSMNRPELYEYLSERDFGDYKRVSLRLI